VFGGNEALLPEPFRLCLTRTLTTFPAKLSFRGPLPRCCPVKQPDGRPGFGERLFAMVPTVNVDRPEDKHQGQTHKSAQRSRKTKPAFTLCLTPGAPASFVLLLLKID